MGEKPKLMLFLNVYLVRYSAHNVRCNLDTFLVLRVLNSVSFQEHTFVIPKQKTLDTKLFLPNLQTIRPMIFRTICIEDEIDFSQCYHLSEKKLTAQIETFLKNYVEKLLREEVPKLLTGHPNQPVLPQVRVRVEYTDEKHQVRQLHSWHPCSYCLRLSSTDKTTF